MKVLVKRKEKKSLGPFRIMYHKEKVKYMLDEMALFLDKNVETADVIP